MDIKLVPIEKAGLSNRSYNALHRAGVHTIGKMLEYNEEDLQQIKNLGAKSVTEIMEKIQYYQSRLADGNSEQDEVALTSLSDEEWQKTEKGKAALKEWFHTKNARIDELSLLSAREYNLLKWNDYEFIEQVAFFSEEELKSIPGMDDISARKIYIIIRDYLKNYSKEIRQMSELHEKRSEGDLSIYDIVNNSTYHNQIRSYVEANDVDISLSGLSVRSKNRLLQNNYLRMSKLIFVTREELQRIKGMGSGSVTEILQFVQDYLQKHEERLAAYCSGDENALWSDQAVREKVLNVYKDLGFNGMNLNEIREALDLPESYTDERLKKVIGSLISDKQLEYVDYRCHRVYPKFEDYLQSCENLDERNKTIVQKRLQGATLNEIGQEYSLTRERVRQIVNKTVEKVHENLVSEEALDLFDEDYYRYFFENYNFEREVLDQWLGVSESVYNYLDMMDIDRGHKKLEDALTDVSGLSYGLRIRIRNYLNRNRIFIDGRWIEKKRKNLEDVVLEKFCKDEVPFDQFCEIYNTFLRDEGIDNESLCITDKVYNTRKNHLTESHMLLWKQHEMIRYYDIESRDYTELFDALNLNSLQNIEVSTVKFYNEAPELMERYDIRDQYELHNLLRKTVPEGSYHDIHFGKMPQIRFGEFDMKAALWDLLLEHSPISSSELTKIIYDEYGYDPAVSLGTYLQPFSMYCHAGIYSVNQKEMSEENRIRLKNALTEDFYFIDEIRRVYRSLIAEADCDEINPYNLKKMGFAVFSNYAIQNYKSSEEFFADLLTRNDIIDLTPMRKHFAYVQAFYQTLMGLKRNLQVLEFEPNQIIQFRKLEASGITRQSLMDFCDEVYDFVEENTYFSVHSLLEDGFSSDLFDLGFSEWFYSSLLISDDRFSFGMMFGNYIFFKGKKDITIKSFEIALIEAHGKVDAIDFYDELTEHYGCVIGDRRNPIYKVYGTVVYYDDTLDCLYANRMLFDRELEEE